jgi:hypothetical protein
VITLHNFNLQATFTYISPSINDFFSGYKPEELLGKSPFEFIHPDDKKKLFSILMNYINAKVKSCSLAKSCLPLEELNFVLKIKKEIGVIFKALEILSETSCFLSPEILLTRRKLKKLCV